METGLKAQTVQGHSDARLEECEENAAPKRRAVAEWLGLHEDRVGPIPGGLAAWLGSVLFWIIVTWIVFG
jgi:hypothetical protein